MKKFVAFIQKNFDHLANFTLAFLLLISAFLLYNYAEKSFFNFPLREHIVALFLLSVVPVLICTGISRLNIKSNPLLDLEYTYFHGSILFLNFIFTGMMIIFMFSLLIMHLDLDLFYYFLVPSGVFVLIGYFLERISLKRKVKAFKTSKLAEKEKEKQQEENNKVLVDLTLSHFFKENSTIFDEEEIRNLVDSAEIIMDLQILKNPLEVVNSLQRITDKLPKAVTNTPLLYSVIASILMERRKCKLNDLYIDLNSKEE